MTGSPFTGRAAMFGYGALVAAALAVAFGVGRYQTAIESKEERIWREATADMERQYKEKCTAGFTKAKAETRAEIDAAFIAQHGPPMPALEACRLTAGIVCGADCAKKYGPDCNALFLAKCCDSRRCFTEPPGAVGKYDFFTCVGEIATEWNCGATLGRCSEMPLLPDELSQPDAGPPI